VRVALSILVCLVASFPGAAAAVAVDPLDYVDPFLGTGGHGHTFPGAALPFGAVQLSPDTRLTGWDGCSGYHFSDSRIFGFSHTHLSGTGASDYGDILLLPGVGEVEWTSGYGRADGEGYGSRFRKTTEKASAGYYAVTLEDPGVDVELTATARTGMHRYTFPASDDAFVLVDLTHRDETLECSLRVVSPTEIEGMRRSRHWAENQRVYFVARFSKPCDALLAVDDAAKPGLREAGGTSVKAALRFATRAREKVLVKVGLSAVDVEGARANLDAENPRWNFDAVHRAARRSWRRALSRIDVQGGSPAQTKCFYTALYHALLQPNVFTDVDGRYRGRDDAVHVADGWTQYTVFSLWDTFRAAHPLYTILEPARTVDFVRTMLAQYRDGGRLPVWELGANETMCMIGYHAVPVITDAWVKGIRDFDADYALEAMKASAMADELGLPAYREHGYVPGDVEGEDVSKTLEYAYDDWCIARLAEGLGRDDDRREYLRRAQAWRHLLDPETGFMRPRVNGRFKAPFDPAAVDVHFTEANSWQYSFFVPQDVAGHVAALGGRAAYAAKLEALFDAPSDLTGRDLPDVTGLVGQYAHGNEPSHHIAYLYAFAGMPWRTQARVHELRDTLYTPRRDGLCGNEDCGQMSAWYVLSALGFYSVTPGTEYYVIGTPLFPKATIRLENGRRFTITSTGFGPYVQSAALGGEPFDRCFLRHDEIMRGGRLAFERGPKPNTAWGVGAGREPPSEDVGEIVTAAPYVTGGEARFRGTTRAALACAVPGATIRYTVDGSTPTEASPAYESPVEISRTTTLRFFAAAPGRAPSPPQAAAFRAIEGGLRVVSCTEASPMYDAGGVDALIDDVRGGADFRLGEWMGFEGEDFEAVVDLGRARTVRRLALGCLQDQGSWIFMPDAVAFDTSLDGERWSPAGRAANDVDAHAEDVVTKDFAVDVGGRKARYVRVTASATKRCPDWHRGAGKPSWVFVDEIAAE
jgi:predicted alpha-1,2-mannosidase